MNFVIVNVNVLSMLKRVFLIFVSMVFTLLAKGQYISTDNYTGTFVDPNSWVGNIPSAAGVNANTDIFGYIISNTTLSFNNNVILTIHDTLIIHGDLNLGVNAELNLGTAAVCIVYGNVVMKNKADLALGSHFIVTGDFTAKGNNQTLTIEPGAAIYILGTVTSSNLPGLQCDNTSTYVPPGDIDCVFGDIISMEDNENTEDGIYDFFVSEDELNLE